MILIMMGVTGTGKSTVAKELGKETGWQFAEGDDYHSEANKAKMASGHPLTDEDREPWLVALHGVLVKWHEAGVSGVLTCSALREKYRVTLRGGLSEEELRFVVLDVPRQVLIDRLAHRKGHFMNPALLDSQFATLEMPADALKVSAVGSPAETALEIRRRLGLVGAKS